MSLREKLGLGGALKPPTGAATTAFDDPGAGLAAVSEAEPTLALLQASPSPSAQAVTAASEGPSAAARAYQQLKNQIHLLVLRRLDVEALDRLAPDRIRDELKLMVELLLQEENIALNAAERRTLVTEIQDEMLGLGPLEPLLADPSVSDILVNTASQIYVERRGKLELTPVTFADNAHLMKIIDKIVSRVGRRVDESTPLADARLADGSRVNVIIPPLAIDGPIVSIRRFAVKPLRMGNLIENRSLSEPMAAFLAAAAEAEINIIVSGGTGSGKTTLLNILSGFISPAERVVTIEDAAELQLQQPHVVRLETRPPNIEGKGDVSQRELVRNALRMRPDRIILGEIRGGESLDMLQAMNTGHEGSMSTIHANTPRDALSRLESMIAMAGVDLPARAARGQIASAIGLVVQISRMTDGSRRVVSISEITGMESDVVLMQDIFVFKQTGVGPEGKVEGYFAATGVRSHLIDRFTARGIHLPDGLFQPTRLIV
ncbi:MAG: CpaF family protein [Proteobacteria bacterium]|uniref:CpaF family protein n=1 Tax=Aquabacterium sp. TaxID=1872578 RepID=UPI0035C6D573|nr:CpaF family protein [Pseudomonadota bacterium]